jgi:hypothetical protein
MCEGSAALLQAWAKRRQPHERGRWAADGGGLQLLPTTLSDFAGGGGVLVVAPVTSPTPSVGGMAGLCPALKEGASCHQEDGESRVGMWWGR